MRNYNENANKTVLYNINKIMQKKPDIENEANLIYLYGEQDVPQ